MRPAPAIIGGVPARTFVIRLRAALATALLLTPFVGTASSAVETQQQQAAQQQTITAASEQSVERFREAAEQGLGDAQFSLGLMYEKGRGVPQGYAQAAAWYRKATEQGHVDAQCHLGVAYDIGQGVPQDDRQAATWYSKAAEQGDARAQYNLGVHNGNGRGVPRDNAQAVALFRSAAERGLAEAQVQLAEMYATGKGVPQDYIEAHMWRNLAAARANGEDQKRYAEMRDSLATLMTPAQIAEAQKRAQAWTAAVSSPVASPERAVSRPPLILDKFNGAARETSKTAPTQATRHTPLPPGGQPAAIDGWQKFDVKIIERQSNSESYRYVVPGYSNSTSNTNVPCNASSNFANCWGATSTTGSSSPAVVGSYQVQGETLSLELPDGRVAVVNCNSKVNWTEWSRHAYRSCRVPVVNNIQAEKELADCPYMSGIERGVRNISILKVVATARALAVAPAHLLARSSFGRFRKCLSLVRTIHLSSPATHSRSLSNASFAKWSVRSSTR